MRLGLVHVCDAVSLCAISSVDFIRGSSMAPGNACVSFLF